VSRSSDLAMVAATTGLGLATAWMFLPQPVWALLTGAIGAAVGLLMARARVRPAVGPLIVGGAMVGAWIGREIIRALCLPGSCTSVEVAGAVFAGAGALFGIGLVVALVVRSFDEYRERGAS